MAFEEASLPSSVPLFELAMMMMIIVFVHGSKSLPMNFFIPPFFSSAIDSGSTILKHSWGKIESDQVIKSGQSKIQFGENE